MAEKVIFAPVSEKDITKAIIARFAEEFNQYVESDCLIIGAGSSGLMLGKEVASHGFKTLIVERNNYLGGGFWLGGYLMNKVTVRAPAHTELDALGVPYEEVQDGLYVADGPHACSKLVAAACDAGVKFANMTSFDDVVLRDDNRVAGAAVNWSPVSALPRAITCVDPIALESRFVVDASGHEACVVSKLEQHGILKKAGTGAMAVERSEDLVVAHTAEIHPGLVVVGMAVSAAYGLPRMGPTFGAMLLSGKKGAQLIIEALSGEERAKRQLAGAARSL